MKLTEAFQFFHRQRVTREMQKPIQQHRAVAVGQYEAVAVGPVWVGRIVFQELTPKNFSNVGHAHGHTGVAAFGRLHRVGRQEAQRMGEFGEDSRAMALWRVCNGAFT